MKKLRFHRSVAALLWVGAAALGGFIACDDSATDADASSTGGSSGTRAGNDVAGDSASENSGGAGALQAAAGAAGAPACLPEPPTLPTDVPTAITAPDRVTLLRHFHAVGTQNYACTATPDAAGGAPKYAWQFVAPVADLFNSCGTKVGSHFAVEHSAPPRPEWEYDVDGSTVVGAKVADSPVDAAIPELLLETKEHSDTGVFSAVSHVQRLKTVGGAAPPAADCNAAHEGDEEDVAYSAEYYFYSSP